MPHPFLSKHFHIRWSTLHPDHIVPDITVALDRAQANLDELASQDRGRMSFESVLLGLEHATQDLNEAWSLVEHLDGVANSPELRAAHNEMLPKVSAFRAKIPLSEHLWDLVKTYSETDAAKALVGVQKRLLDETLAWFRNHGAELPPEKKTRMESLEAELSQCTQKYSENVLDSTNAFELIIDDEAKLKGLPADVIEFIRQDALAKGFGSATEPRYRLSLKAPVMIPVMQYCEDESIRRAVWEGSITIGHSGAYDNTELMWNILALRHEKAQLLGQPHFANHILNRRMAKDGATALAFVERLHQRVKPAFDREIVELQEYRSEKLHVPHELLEPWDMSWWSEKRRKELYDFDPEELRPYFPVTSVIDGMFQLAQKLFGVTITQRETIFLHPTLTTDDSPASHDPREPGPVEVWAPQVQFYEMKDAHGTHIGSFYADWHPRDSKRSGAWMNYLLAGFQPNENRERRPHLGLICGNMSPPAGDKPALLTHDEVMTVFHEFGHLIHQLFGEVEIPSLNGVNVAWDFVELPSQFMENFCWARESLDLFAKHIETGETIPARLFKRMIAARNYMEATATVRQLSFGKLDLELHMHHASKPVADLDSLARDLIRDYLVPLKTPAPTIARRFGHLFASPVGYAASYYSYKWAEVLDADAFTRFLKEGVLNEKTGLEFKEKILSRGNSDDPSTLFRNFMGRDPDPDALLVRSGLA
jgi:oligopeptidase A